MYICEYIIYMSPHQHKKTLPSLRTFQGFRRCLLETGDNDEIYFLYTTEVHCKSYPCSSVGKFFLWLLSRISFSLVLFSLNMLFYIWTFWSLYYLLFSELSISVPCCLSLILKCSWHNFIKYFNFFVIICFSFQQFNYTYGTPTEVSPFLNIYFLKNYFSVFISVWETSFVLLSSLHD